MAEDTATTEAPEQPATEAPKVEETIPYERFQQVTRKAKEAGEQNKTLAKELADLKAQLEEREQAGLPELERIKKDMERTEKRAAEAEAKAAAADKALERTRKERWVTSAAKEFADPSDAAAFIDFDGIEDEKDAERAVKALMKSKPHLRRAEEPSLPGKVLQDGRPAPAQKDANGGPDLMAEAQMLADGLKQFASR